MRAWGKECRAMQCFHTKIFCSGSKNIQSVGVFIIPAGNQKGEFTAFVTKKLSANILGSPDLNFFFSEILTTLSETLATVKLSSRFTNMGQVDNCRPFYFIRRLNCSKVLDFSDTHTVCMKGLCGAVVNTSQTLTVLSSNMLDEVNDSA